MLSFTILLKDIIKDSDEQSGEEIQKTSSGSLPNSGVSAPCHVGMWDVPLSQDVDVLTPEALQTPYFWDFCGDFLT